MGRWAYQPVPSEYEEYSKHGQIIVDIYSGHISTNHNNVIVSATKRIENKLEDVYQIENNINEQSNVINNLAEDYYYLLNNSYTNMLVDFNDTVINAAVARSTVEYIKRGIGDPDDPDYSYVLLELVNAIHLILDVYAQASNYHKKVITTVGNLLYGSSKYFGSTIQSVLDSTEEGEEDEGNKDNSTDDINSQIIRNNDGTNMNTYINNVVDEITEQRSEIVRLRNELISKVGDFYAFN